MSGEGWLGCDAVVMFCTPDRCGVMNRSPRTRPIPRHHSPPRIPPPLLPSIPQTTPRPTHGWRRIRSCGYSCWRSGFRPSKSPNPSPPCSSPYARVGEGGAIGVLGGALGAQPKLTHRHVHAHPPLTLPSHTACEARDRATVFLTMEPLMRLGAGPEAKWMVGFKRVLEIACEDQTQPPGFHG
jgi:hypothetical protein